MNQPSPIVKRVPRLRLTDRVLTIVEFAADYETVSIAQIAEHYFANASDTHRQKVALNLMARIVKAGLLTGAPAFTRWDPQGKPMHKMMVYKWMPANQRVLYKRLEEEHCAHVWESRFARHVEHTSTAKSFAASTMFHEILLTDFLIWLDTAAPKEGWTVVFRERYGPTQEGVTKTWKIKEEGREEERTFSPDALVCLRSPDGRHAFRTVEADKNSTSQDSKWVEKLDGHQLAETSGHFGRLIARKAMEYHIPLAAPPEKYNNVMWTVTHTRERRNQLLLAMKGLKLYEEQRFLYASIQDLYPEEGLANVWLRGKEYTDAVSRSDYPRDALDSVRKRWLADQFATMKKAPPVPKNGA
jgi:hypothetical protein